MTHSIQDLLRKGIELPSPPEIAVRILEEIKKDECSLDRLAAIIETDPALVTRIIRISNSSFYGPMTRVNTLQRALSILGLNAVKNIALSFVLTENMRGEEKSVFDYDLFWRRSVTAAVGAELVSEMIGLPCKEIFITSLLQDLGMVIMFLSHPEQYQKVLEEVQSAEVCVKDTETRIFGFTHPDVGAIVLKEWGFPQNIYAPIGFHHDPQNAAAECRLDAQVLQLANQLSVVYHGQQGVVVLEKIKQTCEKSFNVDSDKVDTVVDEVARRTIEMLSFFDIPPGDMQPFSALLQEANAQLGKLNLTYEQLLLQYKAAKDKAENLSRELQEANRKLRKLATTDGLTGLYNHRTFQDLLEKRVSEAHRHRRNLSLILLDLDHFKCVNDCHGHLVGDAVLKAVSNKIRGLLRSEDIPARYGGEEFALILPETDIDGGVSLAERIRENVSQMHIAINGAPIRISVSLGVAAIGPHLPPFDKSVLVDFADKALYTAKHNGRNTVRISTINTQSLENHLNSCTID